MEEVFAKARALKVSVVRTWAFNDAPEKAGDTAMQIGPLQYDETALRGLDLVLARASVHRVQLVLPLGNYWSDYGGARQYVLWAGLPRPMEGDPRFFTNRAVIDHYKDHLHRLLNCINTVDGLRYGDHPAVLAWELLREGFESGAGHFRKNLESPFIDFGSVHYFPETWNVASEHVTSGGARWIHEHARTARQLGKALFLGEFGLRNNGAFALPERRAMYRGWLACARKTGLAGTAPWVFANDARPDAWDRHTFYFRDGTEPADLRNRYADLILEAAEPP
jgi:mannan endo-1,4-beta-mannosidase